MLGPLIFLQEAVQSWAGKPGYLAGIAEILTGAGHQILQVVPLQQVEDDLAPFLQRL